MRRSICLGFLSFLLFGSSQASLGGMWGDLNRLSDWTHTHDVEFTGETADELRLRSTGLDPYIFTKPIQFSTALYQAVVIEMKVTSGSEAQLFWATQEAPDFSENASLRFVVHPDGQWHQYTLTLAHHSQWKGKVTRLRLDPTDLEAEIRVRAFQIWDRSGPVIQTKFLHPEKPIFTQPNASVRARFHNAGDSPATIRVSWEADEPIGPLSNLSQEIVIGPNKTESLTQTVPLQQEGAFPLRCTWSITQGATRNHTQTSGVLETMVQYIKPAESSSVMRISGGAAELRFSESSVGYGLAELRIQSDEGWKTIGWMPRLSTVVYRDDEGKRHSWAVFSSETTRSDDGSLVFTSTHKNNETTWTCTVRVWFDQESNVFQWRHELEAPDALIDHFSGPMVYINEDAFGDTGREGIFPGVEYLDAEAISSSPDVARPPVRDQFVPHPDKITIPYQVLSGGGVSVALLWPANESWGDVRRGYSPIFSSPNHWQGQANHLMGLMLPTVPNFVEENQTLAFKPIRLGDEPLVIESALAIGKDSETIEATQLWLDLYADGTLPEPIPAPRTYLESVELSRAAYMETCWDAAAKGWGHCVGWEAYPSGGMLVLLDLDARLESDAGEKNEINARSKLVYDHIVQTQGAFGLGRNTGCHVMVLEPVFHWGVVESTLDYWARKAKGFQSIQNEDGSWGFFPDQEHQKELGDEGQVVSGTISRTASYMMELARINADPTATEVALRGVDALNRFRVPKGGQTWECPIESADIIVSAKASRANLDAFFVTGDKQYLDHAVYWARTGLPFHYLWNHDETPLQRYATIPIFGTSFFQVNWRGIPVQWCGLDYAYTLQLLAEVDSSEDWMRLARGILNSGLLQQMTEGPNKGTLPDSYADSFTRAKPAFINPENILTNLHRIEGNDYGIRTVFPQGPGREALRISANADIDMETVNNDSITFTLSNSVARTVEVIIAPVVGKPKRIFVDDGSRVLEERESLFEQAWGWRYVAGHNALLIHAPCDEQTATLTIEGVQ